MKALLARCALLGCALGAVLAGCPAGQPSSVDAKQFGSLAASAENWSSLFCRVAASDFFGSSVWELAPVVFPSDMLNLNTGFDFEQWKRHLKTTTVPNNMAPNPLASHMSAAQPASSVPHRAWKFVNGAIRWKGGTQLLRPELIDHALVDSTVYASQMQDVSAPLARLASSAREAFQMPISIGVYSSPAGMNGCIFPHADTRSFLTIQVTGRKRWVVWNPPEAYGGKFLRNPLEVGKHDRLVVKEMGPPLLDFILEPGAVLYIPAGFPHVTQSPPGQEPSLGVSLGIETHLYYLSWGMAIGCMFERLGLLALNISSIQAQFRQNSQQGLSAWQQIDPFDEPIAAAFDLDEEDMDKAELQRFVFLRKDMLRTLPLGFASTVCSTRAHPLKADSKVGNCKRVSIAAGLRDWGNRLLPLMTDEVFRWEVALEREARATASFFEAFHHALVSDQDELDSWANQSSPNLDPRPLVRRSRRYAERQRRLQQFCEVHISHIDEDDEDALSPPAPAPRAGRTREL